jgi:hypothetical protein
MKKIASFLMCVPLIFSVVHAGETEYVDQTFARLNYITGDTYVQRAADLGYEAGIINMPIAQGDRVGTADGRAEIYLGIGSYLRLDLETRLDILDLPRRSSGITRLRLWDGNMYLSVRRLEEENPIEIHTSDVSIFILDRGLYRIDVRENRETEIFVLRGMAEAAGDGHSTLLRSGQRLEAFQGHFTSSPRHFTAAAIDGFDRWSEYREDLLRRRMARYYLPGELEDFEYELAEYGRWDYISPYGYVWIPGGMSVGWRPYRHGRWVRYVPSGMWIWIPFEPWGWVTSHYGRWHWRLDLGWYWIPTTRWGPGWVSWYVGADYCGWAPLTYYGRPAVIINNHFYARYSEPYYPTDSAAMTVVAKSQLSARDISRVSVSKESLSSKASRVRMSSSAPRAESSAKVMKVHKLEKDTPLLRVPEGSSKARSGSRIKSGSADKTTSRGSESKATMQVTPSRNAAGESKVSQSKKASVGEPERRVKSESSSIRTTEQSASSNRSLSSRSSREASTSKKSASVTAPSRDGSPSKTAAKSGSRSSSSSDKKSSSSSKSSSSKSTGSKKKKKK